MVERRPDLAKLTAEANQVFKRAGYRLVFVAIAKPQGDHRAEIACSWSGVLLEAASSQLDVKREAAAKVQETVREGVEALTNGQMEAAWVSHKQDCPSHRDDRDAQVN